MDHRAPPVIDFSPYHGTDAAAKQHLVEQVRSACLAKGFFQITNHGVAAELQDAVFAQARRFFELPLRAKMELSLKSSPYNRGYEPLRTQSFDKNSAGDLKEGFYLGRDLTPDHPAVVAGKFNMGPNQYPQSFGADDNDGGPRTFRDVVDTYHAEMTRLARGVLRVLALGLGLEESWFDEFAGVGTGKGGREGGGEEPMAVLRLLHYPPQEPSEAGILENGIGAHTDFGAVTLLLQDAVGGLQVFDGPSATWIDVAPVPGAFVVNLGNLMMRWSNDHYVSNLHRVVNSSGRERYSVPFFFSGDPDFVVECLPTCVGEGGETKYAPVSVGMWMQGRYAATYGEKENEKGKAVPELSKYAVSAR